MDEIVREDISPETERELTLPLSPKRQRTDCTVTNNHRGRFDFSERLTFWKTTGSSSPTSTLQEDTGLVCTAEHGDTKDEKPHKQPPDADLIIVTPITMLTTSNTDDVHTGSSEVCLVRVERRFKLLVRDEQPPFTESDNLSSYLKNDAGGALAESHTSKDASADMSSHPDCKRLGKSLKDEPPGGCSLHDGNDKDGRQVQNSVSQIQVFTLSFSDEEVICQSDCTSEDAQHDTGFCDKLSQSAEVEESNQTGDGFSENILFSKEKEEGNSRISSTDYADSKSFYSNPEEQPSGNYVESVKNEEKILELQICENENVAVCDGETKGQFNENGMSKNSIPSAAECAEGSVVSYDVVLARNIATESVRLEADDFYEAKGEHAAGTMIAKARSETADHTTETLMPARISQGPAGGDNDASPFSVIDPAIWSETDREATEKRCSSESSAGVELFSLVKVCEMETPLSLYADERLSREVSAPNQTGQSTTQQCKNEEEDLRQSYTEPQACSVTISETHNNKTGDQGSCHWKSRPSSSPCRPAKPPPAGNERQESHDTMGHELKEQDQSSCFPVSSHHLKTQGVEYLQDEIARMNAATEIKEIEGVLTQRNNSEHEKPENRLDLEGKQLQQNEKHEEDRTKMPAIEGKIIDCCNVLTQIDEGWRNNLECLSDHPYSAAISTIESKTDEEERKEEARVETDVHGNPELLVESEEDHWQQSQQRGDMTEEYICKRTEGNMSNKLTRASPHKQENVLSCFSEYQHRSETFMVENEDDLLAFTFPPTSDAVVPGPHELVHSQNADNNPTPLDCNDRFSPVPSAVTFSDCAPGGFDTFERIQLSPDDDDAVLSNSPLLISLPEQLKTPQQQLSHSAPEAESSEHEEVPEEEEVGRFESRTENMAEGFSGSYTSCNELANFIPEVDVITPRWPEQHPNCESSYNSSEVFQDDLNPQSMSSSVSSKSDSPASDEDHSPKFEMKKQFDMVLKELNLFFQISISDLASDTRASYPEQYSDLTEALEGDTSKDKEHLYSPEVGHHRDPSSDDANEDRRLEQGGGDSVVSFTSGSCDGEQEVPLGSHLCQETSVYTSEKHKGQPEQARRLEPLRTCTRPIRVGLSKRAKTKHLHRPHPYK
ncbi:uncharacterized protein LOC131991718 isoform X2 [Centropristis striata]|uniref:uncharacterized protein LOC131991718 isoform X2 n=1 Tax=Centropristis striata TaxID=184440 RepID=UPI0027E05128|nr:uncharacterized protein LOC131991718 isoform X2 [Centropristis striata]